MALNRKHQINVHTSTNTAAPTGASLYLGEIAVQHTPDNPALWIKMGTSESSNVYEKFIGQTEINTLIQNSNILGSGYTYSGLPYVNSSTTIADAYSALTNEMFKNEQVTAAAFNDINDRIEEISAATGDNDAIKSITLNNTEYTGNSVNLGTVITAETQLSTATTGTGNVITNLTVNNHQITMNKGLSAATVAQLLALSGATVEHIQDENAHITPEFLEELQIALMSGASALTLVEMLSGEVIDTEYVITQSLNDLNDRIKAISASTPDLSNYATIDYVDTLSGVVEDNEVVVAQALNILKDRIDELSGNTGGGGAVTAVTITGTGNAVTNAAFADSALTLTKGNVLTAVTYGNHYNPTGDSPTQITGFINALTFDGKGHIVSYGTGTISDTATTQEGHYTPATGAVTAGTSTTGTFLKTVTLDSKGHYVTSTTGTAIVSIPTAATVINDSATIPTNAAVYNALTGKLGTGDTAADSSKLGNVAAAGYAQTGGTYTGLTAGKTVSALTINYRNGDASTGTAVYNGSANTTVTINSLIVSSVSSFDSTMTSPDVIYAVTGSSRAGVNYVNGANTTISIPVTKDVVCVTGITGNRTINIDSGLIDGQSVHVLFKSSNNSQPRTITLSNTFTVLTGSNTITTSTSTGYAEMNVLYANGQYLVRAM